MLSLVSVFLLISLVSYFVDSKIGLHQSFFKRYVKYFWFQQPLCGLQLVFHGGNDGAETENILRNA
jgi:hypothetical protein